MKILFTILFFMTCFTGLTQLTPEEESQITVLKQTIKSAAHDSTIINAWKAWDEIIWVSDPEKDFQLNCKIDSLSQVNLSKTENTQKRHFFLESRAESLNIIGLYYRSKGEYKKATESYNKSITFFKQIGGKRGTAACMNNLGIIYQDQGDIAKAIDHYIMALSVQEEIGDQQGTANSLLNIGNIYQDLLEFEQAQAYYTRGLEIGKLIGDELGIAKFYSGLGNNYFDQGKYGQVLEYYEKALAITVKIGSKEHMAFELNNLGDLYLAKENEDKAIEYYNRSMDLRKEIGDKKGTATILNSLSQVYFNQKNFALANSYSNRSLKIAQEIGAAQEITNASKALWRGYKALGDTKEALYMHELYILNRDSIESESNQKALIRQEYKYSYEKQAATDSIRNQEVQKVKDAELKAQHAENKQHQQKAYYLYGGLGLTMLFAVFAFNRFRVTSRQKGIIEEQKEKVDEAFDELEEKNKEILDSINYAKRIQNAILPPSKVVKEYLEESFILYKPKDIVAGDFYWLEHKEGLVLFAAADCTGHGVPGAMVSVVCNNGLNRSVREYGLTDPGQILDKTRQIIIQEFEKSEEDVKDGMDIALCSLEGNTLKYAGANNPLWIIRKGEILETKADKQPIGKFDKPVPYTTSTYTLEKGDSIYIFSDGYIDQFGGDKGKKFKTTAFRELLLSIQSKPMEKQKVIIDEAFDSWRGDLEQIDDVCVLGVRV